MSWETAAIFVGAAQALAAGWYFGSHAFRRRLIISELSIYEPFRSPCGQRAIFDPWDCPGSDGEGRELCDWHRRHHFGGD